MFNQLNEDIFNWLNVDMVSLYVKIGLLSLCNMLLYQRIDMFIVEIDMCLCYCYYVIFEIL